MDKVDDNRDVYIEDRVDDKAAVVHSHKKDVAVVERVEHFELAVDRQEIDTVDHKPDPEESSVVVRED